MKKVIHKKILFLIVLIFINNFVSASEWNKKWQEAEPHVLKIRALVQEERDYYEGPLNISFGFLPESYRVQNCFYYALHNAYRLLIFFSGGTSTNLEEHSPVFSSQNMLNLFLREFKIKCAFDKIDKRGVSVEDAPTIAQRISSQITVVSDADFLQDFLQDNNQFQVLMVRTKGHWKAYAVDYVRGKIILVDSLEYYNYKSEKYSSADKKILGLIYEQCRVSKWFNSEQSIIQLTEVVATVQPDVLASQADVFNQRALKNSTIIKLLLGGVVGIAIGLALKPEWLQKISSYAQGQSSIAVQNT